MEITKEILESILDAYSYEIVFVDRQHIVRYMNKTAKERYGERVKINQSLFNCHSENSKVKIEEFLKEPMLVKMKCLKLIILKQVKENSLYLLEILINTSLVILKDMRCLGMKAILKFL